MKGAGMDREVDRFECIDDDGNSYTVIEYQEFLSGGIPGMKRLELDDGSAVTTVDDKTFKIIDVAATVIRKIG